MGLDNPTILAEVIRSREIGQPTPELIQIWQQLIDRLKRKKEFQWGRELDEDISSDAMLVLLCTGLKFDPTKGDNPFSYFTTCIHSSFLHTLAKEKKERFYDNNDQATGRL